MIEFLKLIFEFSKIGLFTFGGGYASLPFLYEIAGKYDWFTGEQLTQFIAISNLTPGPVGLNMATYSGYAAQGLWGALCASFALCVPMIVIASVVFKLYKKFEENAYVQSVLYVLRPTSCALICAVALRLFYNLIVVAGDRKALFVVLFLFALTFKFPRNPVIYIVLGCISGVILKCFSL